MKLSIVLVSTTLILILSILSGCANQEVIVNVKPPPQIDLSKFQRIAIGDFQGRGGVDIAEDLTAALAATNQFQIIDRSKVKSLIKEGRLASSGLMDQKTALELGKLIGIAAYIDGRVSIYNQQEESGNLRGVSRINNRTGIVTVEVSFNVVDLETGLVLLNRKILERKSATTSAFINRGSTRIDYIPLYFEARQAVVQEFMKSISPNKAVGNQQPTKGNNVDNYQNDKSSQESSPYGSTESSNSKAQPNTDNPLNIAWVQKKLNELGYDCGHVDGIMGSNTTGCIMAFQSAQGLSVTGTLDNPTIKTLLHSK